MTFTLWPSHCIIHAMFHKYTCLLFSYSYHVSNSQNDLFMNEKSINEQMIQPSYFSAESVSPFPFGVHVLFPYTKLSFNF